MGFFDAITSKFGKGKLKKEQLAEMNKIIYDALFDWKISDAELIAMSSFFVASELSAEDFQKLKSNAFLHAVDSVIADRRVTDGELDALNHISKQFEIAPEYERIATEKIKYFRLFSQIEKGDPLPVGNPANIILKKNEVGHLCIPADLYEDRSTRHYRGSSKGVSIPVVKGIRFNVGAQRGHSFSTTESKCVSSGHLVITNQRIIFTGDRKSVSSDISKLLDCQLFADALQFSVTNRQKPTTVKFAVPEEVELCAIVISRIINEQ